MLYVLFDNERNNIAFLGPEADLQHWLRINAAVSKLIVAIPLTSSKNHEIHHH